jgi:hypothetical protein
MLSNARRFIGKDSSRHKEAIEFYLETLSEEETGALLNKEILTNSLEVEIA